MANFKIEFCSLGLPLDVYKENKLKALVQLCPFKMVFYYFFNPLSSLSEIMSGFLDLFYKTRINFTNLGTLRFRIKIVCILYTGGKKKRELAIFLDSLCSFLRYFRIFILQHFFMLHKSCGNFWTLF